MEQELMRIAASQGLWAALFVSLLYWVLKENAKREANYQHLLQELTAKFDIVEDIKQQVDKIAEDIRR